MKVESGTWGEAGVFPWALAAAGLSLPACLGSPALPPPRLPALVNVLPGCEQPVSHPPGKHLWEKASAGATGAEPVLERSLLFYLPCSPQGRQSTQEKGNVLRGGSRETCHEGEKNHKWCY